ncbi:MAG: hypothetical protein Ct9H300mP23_02920 [Nitrospinota bacterium]|nr:MAG: hypothetical protein Ct9H300mP23_02920 [Nitrospinota bacterium]
MVNVTKTFNTASWIYYGRREEGGGFFPKDFIKLKYQRVEIFPAKCQRGPPRSYGESNF